MNTTASLSNRIIRILPMAIFFVFLNFNLHDHFLKILCRELVELSSNVPSVQKVQWYRVGLFHYKLDSVSQKSEIHSYSIRSDRILGMFLASTSIVMIGLIIFIWWQWRLEGSRWNREVDILKKEIDNQAQVLHDLKGPLLLLGSSSHESLIDSSVFTNSVRNIIRLLSPNENSENESFDLLQELNEVVLNLRTSYRSLQIDLNTDLSRRPQFIASRIEFRRHLENLVLNSIQAAHPHFTQVTIYARETENGLSISVQDQGPGIPPSILARLGRRGWTFGKTNGTGLGLYYLIQWCEKLKGRVRFESRINIGTTVEIYLPWIHFQFDGSKSLKSILNSRNTNIIVFDDDPLTEQLLKASFLGHNIQIFSARTKSELKKLFADSPRKNFWIFADYYFSGTSQNGLQILQDLSMTHRSLLISNLTLTDRLLAQLRKLGLPHFSKLAICQSLPNDATHGDTNPNIG